MTGSSACRRRATLQEGQPPRPHCDGLAVSPCLCTYSALAHAAGRRRWYTRLLTLCHCRRVGVVIYLFIYYFPEENSLISVHQTRMNSKATFKNTKPKPSLYT